MGARDLQQSSNRPALTRYFYICPKRYQNRYPRFTLCMGQKQAHMRLLLEPSYATLEFELASVLHCVVNAYWRRVQPVAVGGTHFRPEVQVHNVFHI